MAEVVTESEVEEILQKAALSEILPVMFANGTTINEVTFACPECGAQAYPASVRADYSLSEHSLSITGHLMCEPCRMISTVDARFHDDGIMMFAHNNSWKQVQYETAPARTRLRQILITLLPAVIGIGLVVAWLLLRG